MEKPNFDIESELDLLNKQILHRNQFSTVDLALLYNVCDRYIQSKRGFDILTIYEKVNQPVENITYYIMLLLSEEPKLLKFLKDYNVYELLAETINSTGNKKIIRIDDSTIQNSRKRPNQMPIPTDENQIRRIFQALRKNYTLYEQLYKDKVWLINSEDNFGNIIGQEKIKISPYTFFHLLGFDRKNLKPTEGGLEFSKIFPDPNEAFQRLSDFGKHTPNNVYYIMEELLKSEENFLTAAMEGQLSQAINIEKIEMKCFSFERMGVVQTATGMVFFDRKKAMELGYANEVQHINSDVILLNDFIRKYSLTNLFGLDFVISPFNVKKENGVKDQQSIFLTEQAGGGFNSHIFDHQNVSVSSSVAGYREKDFNYSIVEEGPSGGEIVTPTSDPVAVTKFSSEEQARTAQTIVDAFPDIEVNNMQHILNDIDIKTK